MGDAAAERKRAKQAYMQALEDQRKAAAETNAIPISAPVQAPQVLSAAEKREQLLEERRRNFFDKKASENAGGEIVNENRALPLQMNNLNKQQPPVSSVSEPVNLKEWKSKGYPSEYAYAKDVGALEIPKPVNNAFIEPAVHIKINNKGVDSSSQPALAPPEANRFGGNQRQDVKDAPSDRNLFGGNDDRAQKLQRQQDYATQLSNQQQQQQVQNNRNNAKDASAVPSFNIGAVDDKEAKRMRQEEYARALNQQQQQHQQQVPPSTHAPRSNYQPPAGTGLNIGGGDDRDAKRNKQAEYARELAEQQERAAEHARNKPHSAVGATGLPGLGFDSVVAQQRKVQQQLEYANQLDAQAHHTMEKQTAKVAEPVPSFNIGGVDDKELKRRKQEEYTRGLDAQMRAKQQQQPQMGYNQAVNTRVDPNNLIGSGAASGMDDRDLKRHKQEEYARELAQQQQWAEQQKRNKPISAQGTALPGLGGIDDAEAARIKKVQQQQEYARQLDREANYAKPNNRRGNSNNYQGQQQYGNPPELSPREVNPNDIKRAKQQEYAHALLQQQLYAQQNKNNGQGGGAGGRGAQELDRSPLSYHAEVITPGGHLDPGWVMGPLGVPVRKTLEVGNRNVQKAFVNQTALSPKKNRGEGGFGSPRHQQMHPQNQVQNPYQGYPPQQQQPYGMGNYPMDPRNAPPPNSFYGAPEDPYGYANPYSNDGMYGGGVGAGVGGMNVPLMNNAANQQFNAAAAVGGPVGGVGYDLDDRAAKARQLKMEQARELQAQIEANNRLKAEEKKKAQMEEEALTRKIQQHYQEESERLAREKKQKDLDDLQLQNKKLLEEKLEAKRKAEEDEKEKERRDNEKVRREQEIINQRERDELEKEARELQRKQQQQQKMQPPQSNNMADFQPTPAVVIKPQSSQSTRNKNHLFSNEKDDLTADPVVNVPQSGRTAAQKFFDAAPSPPVPAVRQNNSSRGGARAWSDENFDVPVVQQRQQAPASPAKLKVHQKLQYRLQTESRSRDPEDDFTNNYNNYQPQVQQQQQQYQPEEQDDYEGEEQGEYSLSNARERLRQQEILRQQQLRGQSAGSSWGTVADDENSRSNSRVEKRDVGTLVTARLNEGSNSRQIQQQQQQPQQTQRDQYQQASDKRPPLVQPPGRRTPATATRNMSEVLHHAQPQQQPPVNQYRPGKQQDLNASSRFDKTLEFDSKFLLPNGELYELQPSDKPASAATLYNQYMDTHSPPRPAKSNRAKVEEVLHHAPANWMDSMVRVSPEEEAEEESGSPSSPHKHHFSIHRPVEINRDTQTLIEQFNTSLKSLVNHDLTQKPAALNAVNGSKMSIDDSDLEVDNVLRKNRRKAALLDKLDVSNANNNEMMDRFLLDDLYTGMQGISSRPSTANSTRPATVMFGAGVGGPLSAAPLSRGGDILTSARSRGGNVNQTSAADVYMQNYRNKEDGRRLSNQLTRLNLEGISLAEERPSASRPLSGGLSRPTSKAAADRNPLKISVDSSISDLDMSVGQDRRSSSREGRVGSAGNAGYLSARGRSVLLQSSIDTSSSGGLARPKSGAGNPIAHTIQQDHVRSNSLRNQQQRDFEVVDPDYEEGVEDSYYDYGS